MKTLAECLNEIEASSAQAYVYVLYRPCGTPFYVGAGTKKRIAEHEQQAFKQKRPGRRLAIIRKLISGGQSIGYEIASWHESREAAASAEIALIAKLGRSDTTGGPLANQTDGGEGVRGVVWVMTPARIAGAKAAAEKLRGRRLTDEHRASIGAGGKGRSFSEETRAKIGAKHKGKVVSDDTRAKMSSKAKARTDRDVSAMAEWASQNGSVISDAVKARWADPSYRNRFGETIRARRLSRQATPLPSGA